MVVVVVMDKMETTGTNRTPTTISNITITIRAIKKVITSNQVLGAVDGRKITTTQTTNLLP